MNRRVLIAGIAAMTTLLPGIATADVDPFPMPGWRWGVGAGIGNGVELTAVTTGPSICDIWAVGSEMQHDGGRSEAVVGLWAAGTFHRVPTAPAPPDADVHLRDVAVAGEDVWAVGSVSNGLGVTPRIERYRRLHPDPGEVVPTSAIDPPGDVVSAPAADEPGEVVSAPAANQSGELRSIAMSSASEGWAVGYTTPGPGQPSQSLIAHWDGTTWAPTPVPDSLVGGLNAVEAAAPDNVWTVGYTTAPNSSVEQPLVLHWDGRSWARIATPSPSSHGTELLSVAITGNDVWAAGYSDDPSGAIALHRTGGGSPWQVIRTSSAATQFTGVSAPWSNYVWFAAYEVINGREVVHVERWDGSALRVIPIDQTQFGSDGHVASALNGITACSVDEPMAVGWRVTTSSPDRQPLLLRYDTGT